MRWVLPSLVLLGLIGWVAINMPSREPTASARGVAGAKAAAHESDWRLTAKGWRRFSSFHADEANGQREHYPIHPLVVGAFELLISMCALVGFSSSRRVAESWKAES